MLSTDIFLITSFLGSVSTDNVLKAISASFEEGKGIFRRLENKRVLTKPAMLNITFLLTTLYMFSKYIIDTTINVSSVMNVI